MLKLHNLFKIYQTEEVETVALNGMQDAAGKTLSALFLTAKLRDTQGKPIEAKK